MTVLSFFDWSQHLCFRSHGLEAKNEQCAPGSGTDKRQYCQHPSSIRAGSPSIIHTLQWAHAFQTHHQSTDYFWKYDTITSAMQHKENTYSKNTAVFTSAQRSASFFSPGPFSLNDHYGDIWQHTSQCALTNSHFRPYCSRVKRHLTVRALIVDIVLFFTCFCCKS